MGTKVKPLSLGYTGNRGEGRGGQEEIVRQDRGTGNQEGKARRSQGGIGRPRKKVGLREGGKTDGPARLTAT